MTRSTGGALDEVRQRRVDDEQPRPRVLEDVADLVRHQPRVDRDEHGARRGDAEVRLEQLVAFGARNATRSSFSIPRVLERRPPAGARARAARPRSAGGRRRRPRCDRETRAAQRSRNASGRQRREVNRGRDAVPYDRHGDGRRPSSRTCSSSAERARRAITLNRPEKRNALSLELMEELIRRARVGRRRARVARRSCSRAPARRSRPGTT